MTYLTKEILDGFDKYKYSSKDTSPLSVYIMHPFWNFTVQFFPRWLAPNVMTFVGFLLTALNFILLSYYDWNFYASTDEESYQPIPNWVWLFAAINLFLAYTLDGIDGKQARRINLSGPLGELFDHGLDSYSASLIPVCLYSVFGRGVRFSVEPVRFFYLLLTVLLNFYVSHWEKYNTGVLYLPWAYDVGMWSSILIYLVNYYFGTDIWKIPLTESGLKVGHCIETFMYSGSLLEIPLVFYHIYKSYKDKTGKMRSFFECIRPLIPLTCFIVVIILWINKSPNDIIDTDPRAVYLLTGTIFSNLSCRLIVAQMSSTTCETFHWMNPILLIAFIASLFIPRLERLILYSLLIFSTITHWYYGANLVEQMCEHFNRICFGVGKRRETINEKK